MNSQELERARGLATARRNLRKQAPKEVQSAIKVAKEARKKPIRTGIKALTSINFAADWIYILMGLLAIFKDLLDLTGVGSLPILGWFVTIIISLGIFMLWLMTMVMGNGGNRGLARIAIKQGAVLMAGVGAETFLTGANLIPIETIMVVIMYAMVLSGRVAAKIESEEQSK